MLSQQLSEECASSYRQQLLFPGALARSSVRMLEARQTSPLAASAYMDDRIRRELISPRGKHELLLAE